MCAKNKDFDDNIDLINYHLPRLQKQTQDECAECRQICEPEDENEYWQYFVDGNKYCYDCWETLELEKRV